MAETYPRWDYPAVNFIETDPEKIKSEIITAYEITSGRVLADGDPVRLFLLTIADRIIHLQNCINIAGQQNLLTYAQGEALDALGALVDAKRLPASAALTTFEFSLVQVLGNDYTIPAGFEVTNSVVTFATDEELIIPAGEKSGTVSATCTTTGDAGNGYLAGQITTIVQPLAFLDKARNISTTSGGAGIENDDHYADRLAIATNKFSVAGPRAAYEYFVMSISPAIIDAGITSPNPCEVEIYPLTTDGNLPSAELIEQIKAFFALEDVVPMTDKISVFTPVAKEYSINVDFYVSKADVKKSATIRAAVEKAVEEYRYWQQTKVGRDINPDQLIFKVKQAGASVVDLNTLSPSELIALDYNEVAQCTGVTVTYKGVSE